MQKCSLMTCVIRKLLVWSWGALCAKRHASALLKSAPGGITSTVFSTIQKYPHNAYITKISSAAIQLLPCLTVLWALIMLGSAAASAVRAHKCRARMPRGLCGLWPQNPSCCCHRCHLDGLAWSGYCSASFGRPDHRDLHGHPHPATRPGMIIVMPDTVYAYGGCKVLVVAIHSAVAF